MIFRMKMKRIISGVMATLMLLSVFPSLAEERGKEEVIYAVLDANGDVDGVYAVNIFGKGDVMDYGDYTSVQMMNTRDEIYYDGEKVTFTTDAERAYYQGNMENVVMPWLFRVSYYLDGEQMPADEIAGKSGHVDIVLDIRHNPADESTFFKSHALQITATLDTEKCTNILTNGATEANVGQNRSMTWIVLPNNEKNITFSTDAVEFEMPSIAINGIKMSLDIEIDSDSLGDKLEVIKDAATLLDEGASDLNEGALEAYDGSIELRDGAQDLKDGLDTLTRNNDELMDGAQKIVDAVLEIANEKLEDKRKDFDRLTNDFFFGKRLSDLI